MLTKKIQYKEEKFKIGCLRTQSDFVESLIEFVAHVQRRGEISFHHVYISRKYRKYGETRNSCLLSVKSRKRSRHLVF
jgi:hypothetical protein